MLTTNSQAISSIVLPPKHDWTISFDHSHYGLVGWDRESWVLIGDRVPVDVPYTAPTVAAAFFLIVLLLLVAGYYLIGNLRHKDAPGDAKLD
jgi:hypothetical protein